MVIYHQSMGNEERMGSSLRGYEAFMIVDRK